MRRDPALRLRRGERLVWVGRPVRLRLFRISDLVTACAYAGFTALTVGLERTDVVWSGDFSPGFLAAVTALEVCALMAPIVSRVLWWRRTSYVVTSRRVVVIGGRSGKVRASEKLTDLEPPVTTERGGGSGSLAFGRFPGIRDSIVSNFGAGRWSLAITESARPVLWEVADVRKVRGRVARAQRSANRRAAAREIANAGIRDLA